MNNDKKLWFAVDIETDAIATEAIEFALNELGALGTEIDSFLKPTDKPLRVSGYFEKLPEDADIHETVREALRIYNYVPERVTSIATRSVEQTDWLAEWKKHWRPTVIGDFIIAPPWETVDDESKMVIRIDILAGPRQIGDWCGIAQGEEQRHRPNRRRIMRWGRWVDPRQSIALNINRQRSRFLCGVLSAHGADRQRRHGQQRAFGLVQERRMGLDTGAAGTAADF